MKRPRPPRTPVAPPTEIVADRCGSFRLHLHGATGEGVPVTVM